MRIGSWYWGGRAGAGRDETPAEAGRPGPLALLGPRAATRLVELCVDGLEVRRALYAIHHRDKQVTPAMRELVALLRARLGERGGASGRR